MTLLSFSEFAPVDRSLLVVFLIVGAIGVVSVSEGGRPGVLIAAVVHVFGGVLSLFAEDLITLLVSWELLAVSAFLIIRTWKAQRPAPGAESVVVGAVDRRAQAAFRYLVVQVSAAVFFFIAIVIQYSIAGSVRVAAIVPEAQFWVILAVAIKAAMIPAHGWLVTTYGITSVTSLILLSAFSTKVGALTAARLVPVGGYTGLLWFAAAVAAIAPWLAVKQTSIRRLLSYVLIAQVALVLVAVGVSTGSASDSAGGLALTAARFHVVNHVVYKTLLFVVVALVVKRVGHDDLRRMGGLRHSMPIVCTAALVGVGAAIGFPFLNGFASKELLKHVMDVPNLGIMLSVSTVGTALALLRFLDGAFFGRESSESTDRDARSPALVASAGVLALLCVLGGLFPAVLSGVTEPQIYTTAGIRAALILLPAVFLGWFAVRRMLQVVSPGNGWSEAAFPRLGARLYAMVLGWAHGARTADSRAFAGLAVLLAVVLGLGLAGIW